MQLDPGLKAFLDRQRTFDDRPAHAMPPRELRAALAAGFMRAARPAGVRVEETDLPARGRRLPVCIYRREFDACDAGLLYLHGGGWVTGSLETHDAICAGIAFTTGCQVAAIDYALAPEEPYPAAFIDALTAAQWMFENARALGIDPQRVAIGGDSAGGNLSAAVCLKFRDERRTQSFALQVLMYPVLDDDLDRPSYRANANAPVLDREIMRYCLGHYLPNAAARRDPYALPLRAQHLQGLPPAYVATVAHDPLLDEAAEYAGRLIADGVSCEYRCNRRLVHGFLKHRAFSTEAEREFQAMCSAISRGLTRRPCDSSG